MKALLFLEAIFPSRKNPFMRITVVGDSMVLIESSGKKNLTDPFLGTWRNPAYARRSRPALKREDLFDVNLVLISHHHFDHMDRFVFSKKGPGHPRLRAKDDGLVYQTLGLRDGYRD
jgi:L-ascorbate metabolism protein UlaG (beta-lactamase superfamily)